MTKEAPYEPLWSQFDASIAMLGNAITACPQHLWEAPNRDPEFWYLAYHTLFWLDLYLHGGAKGYRPPPPFGLEELDPAGLMPERPYTQEELVEFTAHCREQCRVQVLGMTEEEAGRLCVLGWGEMTFEELHIYNLRHVQHGAAQLNLILRQLTRAAPGWVARGKA